MLASVVQGNPNFSWNDTADQLVGRTAKQCRERWFNYVNPDLNTSQFTEEEDAILMQAYYECGGRWAHISRMLINRGENQTRLRFRALKNKIKSSSSEDGPTLPILRVAEASVEYTI
jgi:hypothetical protein